MYQPESTIYLFDVMQEVLETKMILVNGKFPECIAYLIRVFFLVFIAVSLANNDNVSYNNYMNDYDCSHLCMVLLPSVMMLQSRTHARKCVCMIVHLATAMLLVHASHAQVPTAVIELLTIMHKLHHDSQLRTLLCHEMKFTFDALRSYSVPI